MKLSLVDVPDDYYKDELFFTDPDELKQIFLKLEEDNLSKIHEQQEMAEIYEKINQDGEIKRAELMVKYEEQAKARDEKLFKLRIDNGILSALKKKTAQSMLFEPTSGASSKAAKGAKTVDFTKMLNTLRDKIKKIHLTNRVGSGEVDSKPTLQLLFEIESMVIKYIRNVQRRRRKDFD